jgi:spore germination protein KC
LKKINKLNIKDFTVQGTAVFEKDRLVGWFDALETRGLLFAISKLKSGIINVKNPLKREKTVAFEITKSQGKMDAEINEDGGVKFIVGVKAQGRMAEQQGRGKLVTPEMVRSLEKSVASVIKKNIRLAITKAQWEYKSDVFGFLKILYQDHYQYWKQIEDNWDGIFSNAPVEVKVEWKTVSSSQIRSQ